MEAKSARNVADVLNTHISLILVLLAFYIRTMAENFVNGVISDLLKLWHSNIQLVSGRPRHPQSQGLVERVHQTLHKKMAAEISASGLKTPPWSEWLPQIVCKLV